MPDIRNVLEALDAEDRRLYSQTRTRMRGAYLQALAAVVGIHAHDESDDALLDWIDIKVATLFDRSGRFNSSTGKIETEKAETIEAEVKATADAVVASRSQSVLDQTKNGWKIN